MTDVDRSFSGEYDEDGFIEEVTVPEGEVWYVEGMEHTRGPDDSGFERRGLGVTSVPTDDIDVTQSGPNVSRSGFGDDGAETFTTDAYAYPGDTVFVWADAPSDEMYYKASIRRVA